jgi:hypothetical protein
MFTVTFLNSWNTTAASVIYSDRAARLKSTSSKPPPSSNV